MNTAISTIPEIMLESTHHWRKPNAFQYKHNGVWTEVSSQDFAQLVEELFHGLIALGIQAGSRVVILSENRVEWAVCDYAVQSAGAIVVPVYPTLSAAEIERIVQDSGATLIFVSSFELLEKVAGFRKRVPSLKFVVTFDARIYQPGVMRLEILQKIGKQSAREHPEAFRSAVAEVKAEDLATIIYTSGTTGTPKGVMLTHRNLVSNILATRSVLSLTSDDVELSFLPLSHIFQRHVDYVALFSGTSVAYATDPASIATELLEVRPTFMAGVPRFFEKVQCSILAAVQKEAGLRRALFDWALQQGREAVARGRNGAAQRLADRLVLRKVRERFGGRLRWCASAGAPLEREIAEFFFAIGIPIIEGYGLTETSPVATLTTPGHERIGYAGKPVGDTEVRLAADGEILVRGSGVMKGYFGRPEDTQEALKDGWFHTGDIGRLSPEGYLEITDRKKDLIVTSTGKNIAPQPIEARLKRIPYFESVVVVGDRRNFLSALIVPNMDAMMAYARSRSLTITDPVDLLHHPEIHEMALREIEKKTEDLAGFERIRKIAFLENVFSIDSGELTPTMKIRRSVIERKFQDRIDQLYAA